MSFMEILQRLGADFLVHQVGWNDADSTIADAILLAPTPVGGFWLLGNPNSKYFVSQLMASVSNFCRLSNSALISTLDVAASKTVRFFYPSSTAFSSLATRERATKRIALTLKRNGGVYEDMLDVLKNLLYFTSSNEILSSPPLLGKRNNKTILDIWEKDYFSHEELTKLVKRELRTNYNRAFSFVGPEYRSNGPFRHYNAIIPGGRKVVLTVLPPNVARMRKLDLAPLKAVHAFLGIVPSAGPERSLLAHMINRADVSIEKEASARHAAAAAGGPLEVGLPVRGMVSKHVLVTDDVGGRPIGRPSGSIIGLAAAASSKLLARGMVIADASASNVLETPGGVTFASFASLSDVSSVGLREAISAADAIQGRIERDSAALRSTGVSDLVARINAASRVASYSGARIVIDRCPSVVPLAEFVGSFSSFGYDFGKRVAGAFSWM